MSFTRSHGQSILELQTITKHCDDLISDDYWSLEAVNATG